MCSTSNYYAPAVKTGTRHDVLHVCEGATTLARGPPPPESIRFAGRKPRQTDCLLWTEMKSAGAQMRIITAGAGRTLGNAALARTGAGASSKKPGPWKALAGRTSVHVACAMIVMGGWAAVANHAHGAGAAFRAAVVQAGASAVVTLTLKTSLETMAAWFRRSLAFFVPPTITCCAVLFFLIVAHRAAGTHELRATIAIPYAASSVYAWVYSGLLMASRRKAAIGARSVASAHAAELRGARARPLPPRKDMSLHV